MYADTMAATLRNGQAPAAIYTIGHSATKLDPLVALLNKHSIEAVVDVRSQPSSRWHPQFGRAPIREAFRAAGIRYAFMGDALGGRPADHAVYDATGRVDYSKWSRSAEFNSGIDTVMRNARRYHLALLCSEEDPRQCHRHLLIARVLVQRGWSGQDIIHIRGSGQTISEDSILHQLPLEGSGAWKSPQSVLHKLLQSTSSDD